MMKQTITAIISGVVGGLLVFSGIYFYPAILGEHTNALPSQRSASSLKKEQDKTTDNGLIPFFETNGNKNNNAEAEESHAAAPSLADRQQKKLQAKLQSLFHDEFSVDDFSASGSPFQQIQEMQKHAQKLFQDLDNDFFSDTGMDGIFEQLQGNFSPFAQKLMPGKNASQQLSEIIRSEDDKFVYFEINVPNLESTTIDTKIENGVLNITAATKQAEEKQEQQKEGGFFKSRSYVQSRISRSVPLPENIDTEHMDMTTENNKVILKFPKIG